MALLFSETNQVFDKSRIKELLAGADHHLSLKEYGQCIRILEMVEKILPKDSVVQTKMAWAEYCCGKSEGRDETTKAVMRLFRALDFDDKNDLAHIYLGKIFLEKNLFSMSDHHFKKAKSINPQNKLLKNVK